MIPLLVPGTDVYWAWCGAIYFVSTRKLPAAVVVSAYKTQSCRCVGVVVEDVCRFIVYTILPRTAAVDLLVCTAVAGSATTGLNRVQQ